MAEPTYTGTPGNGPALIWLDAANTSGSMENLQGNYSYRSAAILRRTKASNATNNEIHFVLGEGAPSTDFNAPVGSLYFRTDGGTGLMLYVKFGASAGNWELVSTT